LSSAAKAKHRQRIIELKAQKDRLRAYKIKVKDRRTRIHNYKQQVAALQKRVGR
jgi:hypothetical protein